MTLTRSTRVAAFAVVTALSCALAPPARAEGPVSPTGKGIVGTGLLGGEVVMLTMGAIGVESGWPYLIGGGLGAAGGAIGGYFIEKEVATAEVPVYLLAGGMALVIPTLVVTLNATAYKPPEGDTQAPGPQPAPEPPAPAGSIQITSQSGASPQATRTPVRAHRTSWRAPVVEHVPLSLVDVHAGELALGLPAVEIRPLYSRRELALYGVAQGEEVRLPVFRAEF